MRLEDIQPGSALTGLEPTAVTTVVAVVPIGEGAVRVIYTLPDGSLRDRLLGRIDEAGIARLLPNAPGHLTATPRPSSWPWKPNASTSPFCLTP